MDHKASGVLAPSAPTGSFKMASAVRADKMRTFAKELVTSFKGSDDGKVSNSAIIRHLLVEKINILLVAAPIGVWASHQPTVSPAVVFSLCFVGLMPLAKLLGDATEHLAENMNQTIGGLLNATFGNAVEMIITVSAIKQGLLEIVKKSLLGSILSNLLLVLGMSFFVGGLTRPEQVFPGAAALVNVTMLFVGIMSFCLPTVFSMNAPVEAELKISRISAVFVAIGYMAYLLFQLRTHAHLFEDEDEEALEDEMKVRYCKNGCGRQAAEGYETCCRTCRGKGSRHGPACEALEARRAETEQHEAVLSVPWALALLLVCTIIVAILSEYMVDSIDGLVEDWHVPQAFVGVILLPIVGNACEHASAIRMAYYNKCATSIAIAVGSSTQIALFVMPFSVIMAWIFDQPLDLNFHPTGVTVMFSSVLVVFSIIMDGKSNWLEGFMLMLAYVLVAVLYFYTPNETDENAVAATE